MTSPLWNEWQTCRVCKTATTLIADLGSPALSCVFPKPGETVPNIPLTVRRCSECGLVQLGEETDPSLMYRDGYGYKSGINESMVRHLAEIVAIGRTVAKPGDHILDIGCNDGTLLKLWGPSYRRFGIDPIADLDHDFQVFKEFFPGSITGTFKVITSIAMFYDLHDPIEFARAVAARLDDYGIWILEVGYAGTIIKEGKWDGICHEHLEYYGVAQIQEIAKQAGLCLASVRATDVNGGSILCGIIKSRGGAGDFSHIIEQEKRWDWSDLDDMIRMSAKNIRKAVMSRLGPVYVLGASTKGNTILSQSWLDDRFIAAAIERNPEKVGRVTPGTNIPILPEAFLFEHPPAALLVLPYHFRESLLKRYAPLREAGVKFLFPLPEVVEV